jgi:hypothetical protein
VTARSCRAVSIPKSHQPHVPEDFFVPNEYEPLVDSSRALRPAASTEPRAAAVPDGTA